MQPGNHDSVPWPKAKVGTLYRDGSWGSSHDRGRDFDDDHFDQKLNPGSEQVAGVADRRPGLFAHRHVDVGEHLACGGVIRQR